MYPSPGSTIIVRSPNWLGDAVMVMPAVAALAERYAVSVLVPQKISDVWRSLPHVSQILPASSSALETAKRVREENFQGAVIFPNSLRTALEMLPVPHRLGFRGHMRAWLLTHSIKRKSWHGVPRHQTLDYLELVRQWNVPALDETPLPQIQPPPPAEAHPSYIAICPGAEYGPAKRWPHFEQVAQKLKSHGKIVLLGAKGDIGVAEAIAEKLGDACLNLAGRTSLKEFISWIAHARLLLCNDSGSMHLAALTRTPSVAIFGSTEPRLTGPLDSCVTVLRHQVACSPCFLRECPIDFRCMHAVTVEEVLSAAEAKL